MASANYFLCDICDINMMKFAWYIGLLGLALWYCNTCVPKNNSIAASNYLIEQHNKIYSRFIQILYKKHHQIKIRNLCFKYFKLTI